jgi:hypothetical protein
MRDELFGLLERMTERVHADCALLEVDADVYLGRVWSDVETFARRIGLNGPAAPPQPPAAEAPSESPPAAPPPPPRAPRATFSISIPECFGCLLIVMCRRRLAPA